MKQTRYGIDAPGLVRTFLLGGIALSAVGILAALLGPKPWGAWLAIFCFLIATYALAMFCYMLWGSLITKVKGRDAILNLISWTGDERVLDVGCGRGLLLTAAAHRLTTGHATGIDLWMEKDQSSNRKEGPLENASLEGVAKRVSVDTGDMRALPYADSYFDVVMSHWAVHNLDDREDRACALKEMVRVLRSGGTLLLTDIALREEYELEMKRLGLGDVRLIVSSPLRDRINKLVSFGSFQPATLAGRKL